MLKVALFGGAAVYAALNSLYNVDGGHRAIVFNRIDGIKDKVSDLFSSFNFCYGIGVGRIELANEPLRGVRFLIDQPRNVVIYSFYSLI